MNALHRDAEGRTRCGWCASDPLYRDYHNLEWGFPVSDDVRLFEKLCLEGFQAGLSWLTILRKRENFRRAFAGFEPDRVARFDGRQVRRLVRDPGIVRHRGKIESTINNARRALEIVDEFGSLARFLWKFEPTPRSGPPARPADIPSATDESRALSRELKHRGWTFVGPTTMYALMQAMGLVNDHLAGCDTRERVDAVRCVFERPT